MTSWVEVLPEGYGQRKRTRTGAQRAGRTQPPRRDRTAPELPPNWPERRQKPAIRTGFRRAVLGFVWNLSRNEVAVAWVVLEARSIKSWQTEGRLTWSRDGGVAPVFKADQISVAGTLGGARLALLIPRPLVSPPAHGRRTPSFRVRRTSEWRRTLVGGRERAALRDQGPRAERQVSRVSPSLRRTFLPLPSKCSTTFADQHAHQTADGASPSVRPVSTDYIRTCSYAHDEAQGIPPCCLVSVVLLVAGVLAPDLPPKGLSR